MSIPSLIKIVLNWSMKSTKKDSKEYLLGASTLVEKKISWALKNDSTYIAYIRLFVQHIATENDIKIIKLDYNKGLSPIPDDKIVYNSFTDTPLYKRLSDLKLMKISLQDICNNKVLIVNEIRSAIIKGFEKEVQDYHIEGIAAYPYYTLKPHLLPVAEMNMGKILGLNVKNRKEQGDSLLSKQVSDFMTEQNKGIQEKARTKLASNVNKTLSTMLEYFSVLLLKCQNIDELTSTLEWITQYVLKKVESKLQPSIDLKALMQYVPYLHKDANNISSNFKILYNLYGAPLWEIQKINDIIPLIKSFVVGSLSLENIINDNVILKKYDMLDEIISAIYVYNNKKVVFLDGVFYYNKAEFVRWVNIIPGDMLFNSLHVVHGRKDISILQYLLKQDSVKEIFELIAKNCDINILARIANLMFKDKDNNFLSICDILDSSNFAQIVIKRLSDHKILRKLDNKEKYYNKCTYDSNPQEERNKFHEEEGIKQLSEENPTLELGAIIDLQSEN